MNSLPRTAPLARVKVLSLAAFISRRGKTLQEFVAKVESMDERAVSELFVEVGLAKSITISEDWGTTLLHAVGNSTRPAIIPGNYSANVSMDKLLMDGKRTFSYVTSPDYWYSKHTHRAIGSKQWLLYTYLTIDTKDKSVPIANREIFALMPKSARVSVSTSEVITADSVEMTGYKHRYLDLIGLLANSGILNKGRTAISKDAVAAFEALGSVGRVK